MYTWHLSHISPCGHPILTNGESFKGLTEIHLTLKQNGFAGGIWLHDFCTDKLEISLRKYLLKTYLLSSTCNYFRQKKPKLSFWSAHLQINSVTWLFLFQGDIDGTELVSIFLVTTCNELHQTPFLVSTHPNNFQVWKMFTNVHIKYQKCMLYFYDTKKQNEKETSDAQCKKLCVLTGTRNRIFLFFLALLFVL